MIYQNGYIYILREDGLFAIRIVSTHEVHIHPADYTEGYIVMTPAHLREADIIGGEHHLIVNGKPNPHRVHILVDMYLYGTHDAGLFGEAG